MRNSKFSTLKTIFHKTEKEFSLSDILEDGVDQKYSLSEKMKTRIRFYK